MSATEFYMNPEERPLYVLARRAAQRIMDAGPSYVFRSQRGLRVVPQCSPLAAKLVSQHAWSLLGLYQPDGVGDAGMRERRLADYIEQDLTGN